MLLLLGARGASVGWMLSMMLSVMLLLGARGACVGWMLSCTNGRPESCPSASPVAVAIVAAAAVGGVATVAAPLASSSSCR